MIGQSIVAVGTVMLAAVLASMMAYVFLAAVAEREWPLIVLGLLVIAVAFGATLAAFGI
jgi:predicted exporter